MSDRPQIGSHKTPLGIRVELTDGPFVMWQDYWSEESLNDLRRWAEVLIAQIDAVQQEHQELSQMFNSVYKEFPS